MHSQTVGRYAEVIARELGLSDDLVDRVRLAGILHDVGKIAVPDAILSKPEPLTDEEFAEMKKHPEVGALIIDGADLKDIASWVLGHHERPDGRGYPRGLEDEDIPVEAKVLAVADSYEAMTCDRVYRKAMPAVAARAELERCSGTQFDPRIVEVFVAGEVRRPGLYRVARGSRVAVAVRMAGGFTHQAEATRVSLAAPLQDGQQVIVPARGPGGTAVTAGGTGGAGKPPVSLSNA